METKPTENPDSQAEIIPDLPVSPDQADDVSGGKAKPLLSKSVTRGTHLPRAEI